MQSVKRHIYLERRRLATLGVLSFVAGAMLYSHMGTTPAGVPIPILTGLVYMVAVVLGATVTTYLLPRLKRITDAVAVTRLGFALWVAVTHSYELISAPLVSATIVVGTAILLLQVSARLPVVFQSLSVSNGPITLVHNTQHFLRWLDNAAGYHADGSAALGTERRLVHG